MKRGDRAVADEGTGIRMESRMPSSQRGAIIMKEQVGERESSQGKWQQV